MKRPGMAALAATATLLFSTSVSAGVQVSGHASFDNVQVTVIDLTPDDNVAAGYEIAPRIERSSSNFLSISQSSPLGSGHHQGTQFSVVPVHLAIGDEISSAQAHMDGGIGNIRIDVEADAPEGHSDAGALLNRTLTIVLHPNSELSISGVAAGWVTRDRRTWWNEAFYGSSAVSAQLRYISVPGADQTFERSVRSEWDDVHLEYGGSFSFSAVNDRDHDIELSLVLSGSAAYSADLLPVPEPSTWLMLTAGLLALGHRVRAGRAAG